MPFHRWVSYGALAGAIVLALVRCAAAQLFRDISNRARGGVHASNCAHVQAPILREPVPTLAYRRSGFSSGAPVPNEPMNSFFPSGKVMSRPFARDEPSFAS